MSLTLLLWANAKVGGALSLVTLAIFTFVLAINIHRGNRPVCNCFGSFSSKPIDNGILLRNAILLLTSLSLIGVASLNNETSVIGEIRIIMTSFGEQPVAYMAMSLALAELLVLLYLLKRYGSLLITIETLGSTFSAATHPSLDEVALKGALLAERLAEADMVNANGDKIDASDLFDGSGGPSHLLFTMQGCSACHNVFRRLTFEYQNSTLSGLAIVVDTVSPEIDAFLAIHSEVQVLVQRRFQASEALNINVYPSLIQVDKESKILSIISGDTTILGSLTG